MCARAPDGVADGLGDAATGLPQGRGGSTSCSCDSGPAGGHPPAKNLGMLGVPPLERQRQARVRARQPSPSSDAGAQRAKAPRAKTASAGRTRSCDTLSSLRVPPWASAAPTWGVETRRRLIGGIRRRRCDRLRAEGRAGVYPKVADEGCRPLSPARPGPASKLSDRCQYRPQRCAALPAVRRLTATLRVARVQAPPHPRLR